MDFTICKERKTQTQNFSKNNSSIVDTKMKCYYNYCTKYLIVMFYPKQFWKQLGMWRVANSENACISTAPLSRRNRGILEESILRWAEVQAI